MTAVVVAVSAFVMMSKLVDSLPPSVTITTSDDVAVGECVTMKTLNGEARTYRASCDVGTFHFVVADKVVNEAACGPDYSRSWFVHARSGTSDVLCLAPVYKQGRCYYEPSATGGTALAEMREIDCGKPVLRPGAINFRIDTKISAEPRCAPTQDKYYVSKPVPAGYCLTYLA
ncbi:LppU/SCO3897 family protein [Gordonia terrae]|uniref:LppU/SCO3897 family protein n=1 Tax=Gordonia terrae TaxID=2055 RepID=UPI003F6B0337